MFHSQSSTDANNGSHPHSEDTKRKDGQSKAKKKEREDERLMSLIRDDSQAKLFVDKMQGRPFIEVGEDGAREAYPLDSDDFKGWASLKYFEKHGRTVGSRALNRVVPVLKEKAKRSGVEKGVHLRFAQHDGAVYVNLANDAREVVEVDKSGYRLAPAPPVIFERSKIMKPLPYPARPRANLAKFREALPFEFSDEDWALLQGYLVQAIVQQGPVPVLVITGPQGSGKTTLQRMILSLINPSRVDERSFPKNRRDLMAQARRSAVLAYGNERSITPDLADAFCRLSTGGTQDQRKLYTDDEQVILTAKRPVIINGIGGLLEQPDLIDRCIIINLKPIPPSRRRTEEDVWRRFNEHLSEVFSGLLNAAAMGLAQKDNVTLDAMPRMADFARIAVAAELEFATPAGTFLRAYESNRERAYMAVLEQDPVALAVKELVEAQPGQRWEGNTTKLMNDLRSHSGSTSIPTSAVAMGRALKKSMPLLRRVGIERIDVDPRNRVYELRLGNSSSDSTEH